MPTWPTVAALLENPTCDSLSRRPRRIARLRGPCLALGLFSFADIAVNHSRRGDVRCDSSLRTEMEADQLTLVVAIIGAVTGVLGTVLSALNFFRDLDRD